MSTYELLLYGAGLVRDPVVLIVAASGLASFAGALINLLRHQRVKVPGRALEGGLLGFMFGVLGCLAPADGGLLFGRGEAILVLALGVGLWTLVFVVRRRFKLRV